MCLLGIGRESVPLAKENVVMGYVRRTGSADMDIDGL